MKGLWDNEAKAARLLELMPARYRPEAAVDQREVEEVAPVVAIEVTSGTPGRLVAGGAPWLGDQEPEPDREWWHPSGNVLLDGKVVRRWR